jgi:hypothetical protein
LTLVVMRARTAEPRFVEGRFELVVKERLMHGHDASSRPGAVVQLRRLPRLAGAWVGGRITGQVEGRYRDVVHSQMIGVAVPALVIRVGEDHVRPFGPDDGDEATDCLVKVRLGEALRVEVGVGILHAGVAVAEPVDLVVADDACGLGELLAADLADAGQDGGGVQCRVQDLTLLATGAAHEHGARPGVGVASHRAGTLGRLVVGVGVNGEDAKLRGHWACRLPALVRRRAQPDQAQAHCARRLSPWSGDTYSLASWPRPWWAR